MTKNTDILAAGNPAESFRGYASLLRNIKQRVQIGQQRAIYAANEEMLHMYWDIGEMLQRSLDADGWGKKTLQRLAVDLKNEISEIKGLSVRNMQCMMQFFNEYNQELTMVKEASSPIAQPVAAQLEHEPMPIAKPLVSQLDMGRQYHIEVSGDDYYIDILMYNAFLHRYMVIELKDTEFMPEYIGKLNFYCSAVDDILCREGDNRTIGLLLCRTKDRIKAEYALRDIQKPIGISDYELGQALPKDFRGSLPTIEEIERALEADN